MAILKPDPWRPDHGAGAEAPFDNELARPQVDPDVETNDWSEPLEPGPAPDEPVIFVDGVMRTELRVLASEGDARAWGLLGSFAAGATRCDGEATFIAEDEPIHRVMIVGSRVTVEPLTISLGGTSLTYLAHPSPEDDPTQLRRRLQRLMLAAERDLAARLADGEIVFADGPLQLNAPLRAPVVGVVKRMVATYLEPPYSELLPKLEPGQRTPLFSLGGSALDRFSWYQRLIESPGSWHELAGIARCEVPLGVGLDAARSLADRTASILPGFAGRPGVDPRAPQNLTPVGALESRLKHRLGSAAVIYRALQEHLAEVDVA